MVRASCTCWALKCPINASVNSGILARILPLAISASTRGSRSPAINAPSMARAETLVRLAATEESLMLASVRHEALMFEWR